MALVEAVLGLETHHAGVSDGSSAASPSRGDRSPPSAREVVDTEQGRITRFRIVVIDDIDVLLPCGRGRALPRAWLFSDLAWGAIRSDLDGILVSGIQQSSVV